MTFTLFLKIINFKPFNRLSYNSITLVMVVVICHGGSLVTIVVANRLSFYL